MQFSAFAVPLDEEIRGGVRPAMWMLSGAVAFLLLIACSNVASLLLVRGDARLREMALRTAVGAGPSRLVRQLFTESLLLAMGGAVIGLAVAVAGLRTLMALDPTSLPPLAPVAPRRHRRDLRARRSASSPRCCSACCRRCARCA